MKKKHDKDGSYSYTPEFGWEDTKQKEHLVRRAWESIRRSPEFQNDCKEWSQLEGEAKEIRSERLKEKWGVAVFDPEYSYNEIKNESKSIRETLGPMTSKEEQKTSIPDIPSVFSDLYNRLSGFSGHIDLIARCREEEEMMATIMKEKGKVFPPPIDQWPDILNGRWNPSRYAHFTIDIEAPIKDILSKVEKTVGSIYGLRMKMGFASLKDDKKRYHFDDDDENFRVYDLFEQGKTADEIIQIMLPKEYKEYGGRDTVTADKGRLIQKAYDKRNRIEKMIEEYVDIVKHPIKI